MGQTSSCICMDARVSVRRSSIPSSFDQVDIRNSFFDHRIRKVFDFQQTISENKYPTDRKHISRVRGAQADQMSVTLRRLNSNPRSSYRRQFSVFWLY